MSLEAEPTDGEERRSSAETDASPPTSTGERTGDATADAVTAAIDSADEPSRRRCSRRTVLAAAFATAGMSAPVVGSVGADGDRATMRVTVYAGPTPMYARLRDGLGGLDSCWTSAHEAAMAALEDALAQVETHAEATGRDWIDVAADRGGSIGSPLAASSPLDAVAPADRLYDRFREVVAEGRDDARSHLLLWWGPFDYRIGYGRTLPDDGQVGRGARPAGLAVANIGATEGWDGRPVTRNMAIHEALHTYLSPADAEAVAGSRCDHDLGGVREPEPGIREVSPMATAYAGGGASRRGPMSQLFDGFLGAADGGTRWIGRGCAGGEALLDDEPVGGGANWRHATTLTPETKEAVCRYIERTLG